MFEAQGRVRAWVRLCAVLVAATAISCAAAVAQERPEKTKPPAKNLRLLRSQWDRRAIGLETPLIRAARLVPVTVGVIDTGVDLRHPDLRHRLRRHCRLDHRG